MKTTTLILIGIVAFASGAFLFGKSPHRPPPPMDFPAAFLDGPGGSVKWDVVQVEEFQDGEWSGRNVTYRDESRVRDNESFRYVTLLHKNGTRQLLVLLEGGGK